MPCGRGDKPPGRAFEEKAKNELEHSRRPTIGQPQIRPAMDESDDESSAASRITNAAPVRLRRLAPV